MNNIFDKINSAIEDAEGSIITLVTSLIPWLAPALPAWLTFDHLQGIIGVPLIIAIAMAITVEFLGLSAVSTAFHAMRHNRTHRADKRKVNLAFPVGAYIFYIFVIVTVNIVSEIPIIDDTFIKVTSIALLTLISTPAFIIAVSRQEQREIDEEFANRVATGKSGKSGETVKRWTYDEFAKIQASRNGQGPMTAKEVSTQGNMPLRTAYRFLDKYEKAKNA